MPRYAAMVCVLSIVLVSACSTIVGPDHQAAVPESATEPRTAPLLQGMGDLHYPISTDSALAQRYFDQGLILAYGFNHLEAERSFREAARLDDTCAICFWGAAMVLGPNINAPMPREREQRAYATLQEAWGRVEHANDVERALIEALTRRYSPEPPVDRAPFDRAYADEMRKVAGRFPGDLEVQALFVEAMMDTMPWDYWREDGQPKPLTQEVFATLDSVLARNPSHAGANHFYIHAVEQEQPRRGVAAADRLRQVVPGAGHLVHMPSHIYIRVGRYHDGSTANERAIESDNEYVTQCRAQGIYPVAYVPHNHHFLWATTSMEGRSADALAAARHTAAHVEGALIREPGMEMLQHFSAIPLYALVRFGKWDAILSEPAPDADLLYPKSVWHYARGIAYVRRESTDRAIAELAQLRALSANPQLKEVKIWGLNPASSLADIAAEVLAGEIAASRGDYNTAIVHLRTAIDIEDALIYGEPPDWFYPARHNLGAVLLEARHPGDAEVVYREDLAKFPENGWALFGLVQSLTAQGKHAEAADARRRFELAWRYADVQLERSRF